MLSAIEKFTMQFQTRLDICGMGFFSCVKVSKDTNFPAFGYLGAILFLFYVFVFCNAFKSDLIITLNPSIKGIFFSGGLSNIFYSIIVPLIIFMVNIFRKIAINIQPSQMMTSIMILVNGYSIISLWRKTTSPLSNFTAPHFDLPKHFAGFWSVVNQAMQNFLRKGFFAPVMGKFTSAFFATELFYGIVPATILFNITRKSRKIRAARLTNEIYHYLSIPNIA